MNPLTCFVVIYLIRARIIVVVPESWVQDLNNARLKNRGVNSNQNFLVFWAGINGGADLARKPNFNAPFDSVFDASAHGICYLCRILKFFGESSS